MHLQVSISDFGMNNVLSVCRFLNVMLRFWLVIYQRKLISASIVLELAHWVKLNFRFMQK